MNIIIYRTKHGSTREYVDYILENTESTESYTIDEFSEELLNKTQKVVIGSSTYMGKIKIKGFIVENWDLFKNKEVYIFSVGLRPADAPASRKTYEDIPEYIRNNVYGYIKLPGRLKESELGTFDKILVKAQRIDNKENKDTRLTLSKPIIDFLSGK